MPGQPAAPAAVPVPAATSTSTSAPASRLLLGPGDDGEISVYGIPDMTQKFTIDSDGEASFALLGKVKIGGLTAPEAEALLAKTYVERGLLRDPHVTVTVRDYTTQGISVLGEVTHPGTYSALKVRRLFDAFLVAGGTTTKAGNTISISRPSPDGKTDTIHVTLNPSDAAASNVTLHPGDTVVVNRAGIVYVLGEVGRPGGFVIDNPDGKLGIMEAIAMAAGPTRLASLGKSRILRHTPTGIQNVEVDVKKVMMAKAADVPLQAEDILFIPPSRGKMAAERGTSSILSMVTQLAIYHF